MTEEKKQLSLEELNASLDSIRPHLAVDGGDVEVVELTDDGIIKIKWIGNCINCSMSAMTMKAGIEQTLKAKFPNIKKVEPINGLQV